jgi:hypothetical protein
MADRKGREAGRRGKQEVSGIYAGEARGGSKEKGRQAENFVDVAGDSKRQAE